MRHIKIFENYSEEELDSLQQDLEGIGHTYKFERGKDFGLGPGFKGDEWLYNYIHISEDLFNTLLKRGEIIKKYHSSGSQIYTFKTPEKFGFVLNDSHKAPVIEANFDPLNSYMIEYQGSRNDDDSEIYNEIMKKLGEVKK